VVPSPAFYGGFSLGKRVVRGASLWNPTEKQFRNSFRIKNKAGAHLPRCWILLLGRLNAYGGIGEWVV
ncbi:MAG: hypothetical protein WCK17_03165, partial [Verrucomicrobiota bacterium]